MGWGAAKGAKGKSSKGGGGSAGTKGEGWKGKGGGGGKGGGRGGGGGGRGGAKPTDDPSFVRISNGARLQGSSKGVDYVVEAPVASGTFSRVFRVREEPSGGAGGGGSGGSKRRWGPKNTGGEASGSVGEEGRIFAAKVMRATDSYIQYTSDAQKEGDLLQRLERAQVESGGEVLTMRCFDSFATRDDHGQEYWCLILEWLDASLFDVVRANRGKGLHLALVRVLLRQLLEQLRVLQEFECTHTDIKHKNCCLADTSFFVAPIEPGGSPTLVLAQPLAKFIDYGNAVFEGEAKTHPIHTKQFRAPEVLLNVAEGWGPPSDTWTLGITAAYLISGQLIFNSHDPSDLIRRMVAALGRFPVALLDSAKDGRLRRVAESAAGNSGPALAGLLGLQGARPDSAEAHCLDLVQRLLAPLPRDRIRAQEALAHPFLAPSGGAPPLPSCPEGVELRRLGGGAHSAGW